MRYTLLVLVTLAAAACGRKAPPGAPAAVETETRCSQTIWRQGEARPANVEILNRSADSVSVWLDRCMGHTRVADIGAGDSVIVPLPNGAVSFEGKLRFMTYRGARKAIAVELAAPEGTPHIRLLVPETAAECPRVFVNGRLYEKPISTIPRDRVEHVEYLPSSANGDCQRINVRLRDPGTRVRNR